MHPTVKGASSISIGAATLLPEDYAHWSNTELHFIVPDGATSGDIVVTAEGGDSNPVYFDALTCTADEVGLCDDGIDNDCDGLTDADDEVDCPPINCSNYTDKSSCNADPACHWKNKDKVCLPN